MDITKFIVSQRDNALSVGDYKTYQHSLTRRLASLRKRLGRATPKNGKFAQNATVTVEDISNNHEFVHLLLLSADRAYGHAMAMKATGTEDGSGLPGATRRHIADRLNKAAKYAKQLAVLLENKSTTKAKDTDVLEAKAYAYSLFGAEQFEKHAAGSRSSDVEAQRRKWRSCLQNYSAARVIYAALLKATKEDLFKEHIATAIDPSIRFAAYQSHIPRTVPAVTVSRKCFPEDEEDLIDTIKELDPAAFDDKKASGSKDADIPSSITWRSRKAKITDASIGQALASVATATNQLAAALEDESTKDKAAAYDPVLIAAQDAADATRHAIDDHEKEKIDESDSRMQDLRVANLAVNYDLIGWRIGRNRLLIGPEDGATLDSVPTKKSKRPRKDGKEWTDQPEGSGRKLARLRERVVLYGAILQSLESVKEVPGAVRDDKFVEELEGKKAYFQALKCLNIAYSHALLASHRNALALLIRAETLSAHAYKSLSSSAPSSESLPLKSDIPTPHLQSLHKHISSLLLHHRALVELHNHAANSVLAAKKGQTSTAPVVESLNTYPASGEVDLENIVEWPPRLKPVPVKPLFFDTAWNYIEYPGRAPVAEALNGVGKGEEGQGEEKGGGRGWFGFGRK